MSWILKLLSTSFPFTQPVV